jgi:hypothetical protein
VLKDSFVLTVICLVVVGAIFAWWTTSSPHYYGAPTDRGSRTGARSSSAGGGKNSVDRFHRRLSRLLRLPKLKLSPLR